MTGIVTVVRGEEHDGGREVQLRDQSSDHVVDLPHQAADEGEHSANRGPVRGGLPRRRLRGGTPEDHREALVHLVACRRQDRVVRVVHRRIRRGRVVGRGGCGKDTTRNRGRSVSRVARKAVTSRSIQAVGWASAGSNVAAERPAPPPTRGSRQALVDQPLVVVVEQVASLAAQRSEALRIEVLAQPHRLDPWAAWDRREVHLPDQGGLEPDPELVRDSPEPFAQGRRVLLRRDAVREEPRQQRDPGRHADRRCAVGRVEDDAPGGQRVELGRLEVPTARVADLIVPLRVGHHEDEVGPVVGRHGRTVTVGLAPTRGPTRSLHSCHRPDIADRAAARGSWKRFEPWTGARGPKLVFGSSIRRSSLARSGSSRA